MAEIESHVHQGAVTVIPIIALMIAVLGTIHLYALGAENRLAKALLALGL